MTQILDNSFIYWDMMQFRKEEKNVRQLKKHHSKTANTDAVSINLFRLFRWWSNAMWSTPLHSKLIKLLADTYSHSDQWCRTGNSPPAPSSLSAHWRTSTCQHSERPQCRRADSFRRDRSAACVPVPRPSWAAYYFEAWYNDDLQSK